MAEGELDIEFLEFMEQFCHQQENIGCATMLNEQVDSLLAANGQLHKDCLVMDQAPSGKMEFFVFDALLMREEITRLGFAITFDDASCLPPLLSQLNDRLLEMIALGGMSLSGS
jgi:hypothetical protein